ncbi:MAG: sensor histidine kinase [Janthinobacterium lividum]
MAPAFSWPFRSFWSQWLLHCLVLWTLTALADSSIGWFFGDPEPWRHFGQLFSNLQEAVAWAVTVLVVEALYHQVFQRRSFRVFLGSTLAAAVALGLLAMGLNYYQRGHPIFPLSTVVLIVMYAVGYTVLRHFLTQRYQEAARRAAQSQTELATLRAHLNPHFFFNTINTLYGTALEENAPRTAECVERLAGLMRYTLREVPNDTVPMAEEMQFVRDYLALQQLRLPATLDVRTTLADDGQAAAIAPLLLLPFLENAFAYGISVDQPCFLHLALHSQNGELTLELANRVLRYRPAGAGTGLRNVRQRLGLLYPGRHTLHITETADTFTVYLRLRLGQLPW